jgi:hypothetical protein
MSIELLIDRATAIQAVQAYNRGFYNGRPNVEIDFEGYTRFRSGLSQDYDDLIEQLRFIGEDYGGAQPRFLSHSIRDEAALIAAQLAPNLDYFMSVVTTQKSLTDRVPSEDDLTFLFRPFVATKRWGVWASKTLHFLRPVTFPVLDSRAKKALGVASLGGSGREYRRFCSLFRDALIDNAETLQAAAAVDADASPTELKLLDKILYETGR